MGATVTFTDDLLRTRLRAYCHKDSNHWSFRGNAVRHHGHAYFQYPAMMVPQMVGDLLTAVSKRNPDFNHVYDPFAGSGTSLTEAMMRGLHFTGQDINPLAVLLCKAKAIPFFDSALEDKLADVLEIANSDEDRKIEADFPKRTKWFSGSASLGLSRLRRAIRAESALWARRFLWVALAETVRLTSNSRTSTFKLHIRPQSELDKRRPTPLSIFEQIAERNIEHLRLQKAALTERYSLTRGHYGGRIAIRIADSAVPLSSSTKERFDILVTSPPYGDNVTTVPYGQHSYLPLQWIDLADISPAIDPDCLKSTHEIDRRSLGGTRKGVKTTIDGLRAKSETLSALIDKLRNQPADRVTRIVSFCRDLDKCLDPILQAMRADAVMIWILGNRRVGGEVVPLDRILSDFLIERGSRSLTIIRRQIPSKRMAIRNNVSATMRSESIVVLRKGRD